MLEKPVNMTWDEYWLNMCHTVAQNSKCLSRKIGAIIVRDKSILSTGYNGPPRGVMQCHKRWEYDLADHDYLSGVEKIDLTKCPRYVLGYKSGQGLDICIAGHAERNALINAAREGVRVKGFLDDPTTLYMSCGIACTPCLVEIINAGVTEIVCTEWSTYDKTSNFLLEHSSLKARLFDV